MMPKLIQKNDFARHKHDMYTDTILKQIKGCLWLTCGLIILPVYFKSVKK